MHLYSLISRYESLHVICILDTSAERRSLISHICVFICHTFLHTRITNHVGCHFYRYKSSRHTSIDHALVTWTNQSLGVVPAVVVCIIRSVALTVCDLVSTANNCSQKYRKKNNSFHFANLY